MFPPRQRVILPPFLLRLALLASLGMAPTAGLLAQQALPPSNAGKAAVVSARQAVSADALKARLKVLEARQDVPPDEKTQLNDLLTQALAAAERAGALNREAEQFTQELARAPVREAEIKAALARPLPTFNANELGASVSAADAEAKLSALEAQLATARQSAQTLTDALAQQRLRPEVLQANISEAQQRLTVLAKDLKAPAAKDDAPAVVEARQTMLAARQRMRNSEVSVFGQELAANDKRVGLLAAELELAQRELAVAESARSAWQAVVQGQRETAAAAKATEAAAEEQALSAMPAQIRAVAEQNTALAAELQDLARREADITQQLTQAQSRLQEVAEDFAATKERVELAGLNDTIALVLRKQRDALPGMRDYRALAQQIRSETARASGRQLDNDAMRRELIAPDKAAARIVDAIEPSAVASAKPDMLARVSEALRKQREFAGNLYDGYGRYIKELGKLDNAERTLVSRAEEFNRLIDENLLWIRSAPPVSAATLARAAPAFVWLAAPAHWSGVVRDLWRSTSQAPFAWILGLSALALAFFLRARARRDLARTSAQVGDISTDSFTLTVRAFLVTLVLAATWPLISAVIGWPLFASAASDAFSRALGGGLFALALIGFGIALLKGIARDGGLGDVHFGWPVAARHEIRRQLSWLALPVLPLALILWTVETYDEEVFRASLGRAAFVLLMLALTVFIIRVLRPHGALLAALESRRPNGLIVRLKYLWIPAVAVAPAALAVLSLFGYHYSAMLLQIRLQATAWIVIVLVIVSESLMRWLYITHRRLAHEQALQEQEAAHRALADAHLLQEDDDGYGEFEEPEIDLDAIQAQTSSLIRTVMGVGAIVGLWITWGATLPALEVLNNVTLWHYPTKVDGVDQNVAVTLVDAGIAALVTIFSYLGTKNLPGALELAVLNRTSLDAGAKYAYTTLFRYVIAGVGIVLVFNYLGMEWSRLQWMVAALGVGLGFGMQEIVANFISGLILLFERPIRVGDVVTIDGSSGTVSRIRIRATTITDWDRKELIVPNKRFITGEVLNWTLSNEMNRILINVGVAYGADTKRARELLLQAAREHPRILEDPAPVASFEGFGDNTLDLVLRCYMPSLDGRVGVLTDLHSAIDAAFKEAGIEISFPQRDVHLDARAPLEVRVLAAKPASPGSGDAGKSGE